MSSQRLLRRLPAWIPDPLLPEERPQPTRYLHGTYFGFWARFRAV
jgi:hypothetical protein